MAFLPPVVVPQVSLFGSQVPSTSTYRYGANLPAATSDYSVWGSTGPVNPYVQPSNTYTPGTPTPLPTTLPENVANVLPGGSDSWVDPNTGTYGPGNSYGWANLSNLQKTALGVVAPGFATFGDLLFGINPTGGVVGPKYFDYYSGPGSEIAAQYGIGAGEQRDMLIEQELGLFDSPEEYADFFSDGGEIGSSDYDAGNYSDWSAEEFESDFGLDDFGDLSDW